MVMVVVVPDIVLILFSNFGTANPRIDCFVTTSGNVILSWQVLSQDIMHYDHSTDSEGEVHNDGSKRRLKRRPVAVDRFQNLSNYVFRTDPNLIDYRLEAFKHEKKQTLETIKEILAGTHEDYLNEKKLLEQQVLRLNQMLDQICKSEAQLITQDFEFDVERAKRIKEEDLEECRQQIEANIRNALDGVESSLADLDASDAIEAVIRPELTGIQPGITKRTLRSRNGNRKTNRVKPVKRKAKRDLKLDEKDILLSQSELQEDLNELGVRN
eukprot:gene5337-8857_t